ncbi:metalloregulator ArsR/SmtB family transcription factor [Corallococcus sp. bb12-1]|uniref:ArsR/SmtB family transcription factor n=1 Tax=Corallococcus sp. bb12-1 TaxID=2996784 RepID=UPI00226FF729|nr:metalloregulator ArsR/SmtB family transcription factor [Corallococcus sp. bb12-1]MCY1044497.1 metalloregulator ArsR/SmtB family transcription factor [Corallococcus sp. bb12-1]
MLHALDALGNPVRREILLGLRSRPATVAEIASRFPVSRPAISRHLAVLHESGLVSASRSGTHTYYSVRIEGFVSVRAFLDGFWDTALGRLQQLALTDGEDES